MCFSKLYGVVQISLSAGTGFNAGYLNGIILQPFPCCDRFSHALPQSAKLSMILNMYTETFCCNGIVFYYLWGGGGGFRGGGVILKILTVFFGEGGHFQIRERYRGLGYFNRFHETNTSTKERELRMNVTVNNNGKHRP